MLEEMLAMDPLWRELFVAIGGVVIESPRVGS
jgi:hypothetical protein